MATVRLEIADPANRLTLKTLLESEGHEVGGAPPDAIITDNMATAVEHARQTPTLVLATLSQLREAVEAMGKGVYGYVCVPFLPGEVGLMVSRACGAIPSQERPVLRPLHEMEADQIRAVLRACKGNQAEAARVLGIGRNTLWRKLKKRE